MKTSVFKTVAVLLIGTSLGGITSALYYRHLLAKSLGDSILNSSRNEIIEATTTLTLLREQKYSELIKSKEEALSGQIYALSFLPLPTDEKELKVFRMAVRYLQMFPYETGDSNVDQSVKDFLAKVH